MDRRAGEYGPRTLSTPRDLRRRIRLRFAGHGDVVALTILAEEPDIDLVLTCRSIVFTSGIAGQRRRPG